jgi:putative protein-disulfide isomerase
MASGHGMNEADCSTDGVCTIPARDEAQGQRPSATARPAVVYFGDPMCSWCWGISPQLRSLRDWCVDTGLPFRLVMGGLRAGGGDAWDSRFRDFLRHHWREVASLSGQPFNIGLLERDFFEYDTEPACRAVATARMLGVADELGYFIAVQRGFYVDNEDPKLPAFHAARCAKFGLDPEAFVATLASDAARDTVRADFSTTRRSGVTGFPTIAVQRPGGLRVIASGYATFLRLREDVERCTRDA